MGSGMVLTIASNSGCKFSPATLTSVVAVPVFALVYRTGKVDLLFLGVEVDEKVVNLVQYFLWTCVGTVNLVDDQNRGQMSFKSLAQDVAGLRQRAFAGVDQQHDTVDHLERAFYFSAEVAVAGRVNDVDLDVVIEDGGVFRQNRNAALTLEIVGVHDALDEVLVGAKSAALPEHGVNQGGLAVVDMGDDCDIADAGIQKSEAFPRVLKTESLYHFTMYLGFRSELVFLSCCHRCCHSERTDAVEGSLQVSHLDAGVTQASVFRW